MSDQTIDGFTENDTLPVLPVTYTDVPVTDFLALGLHVKYKPHPLIVTGTLDNSDATSFSFAWRSRVSCELQSAASVGDGTISVTVTGDGEVFADLPASGEIVIGKGSTAEHILYTSKTLPSTLTLASTISIARPIGTPVEKLPDLRAGVWKAEVETIDATGGRLTFTDLVLKIEPEIA